MTHTSTSAAIAARCLTLLRDWARYSERHWYNISDSLGCYGTGYNGWGVQTNQKYLGAMAVLATMGDAVKGVDREFALRRAMASLRFSLHSHVANGGQCTDGTAWGHTWISPLGTERMMGAVQLLQPHFTDHDHEQLRDLLVSECDWLLNDYDRNGQKGVVANPWNHSQLNGPESNLWVGAHLWRVAMMYPQHEHAQAWIDKAHEFLINAVSVADDAENDTIIAGKSVRDRHVGANFFPNYALDHHGYLNVGYMVICTSNAAMLHFDMKMRGLATPESLYHHQHDLWSVVRRMIFADARLARIGGDTRVRYAYCQEYLLPSLLFAADKFDDAHAMDLIGRQVTLIEHEAKHNEDGSFYSNRLSDLSETSPYYYTRLESDRAIALAMVAMYLPHTNVPARVKGDFESSVSGLWCDHEHGAVMHRSATRLTSFAWRAKNTAQGMCQPPDDSHLAEWHHNLAGVVTFNTHPDPPAWKTQRRLLDCHIDTLQGGFVTFGSIMEGADLGLAEGWSGTDSALHQLAVAALPDDHTYIALQHCRTANKRTYLTSVKGMHLNVPNDLYNDFTRTLVTAQGTQTLAGPPEHEQLLAMQTRWANIEQRIGVVGLYGSDSLVIHRTPERRGGHLQSLHVEEICFGCHVGMRPVDANTLVLDVGWCVMSSVDANTTAQVAQAATAIELNLPDVRAVRVPGRDGRKYVLLANFGREPASIDLSSWTTDGLEDVCTNEALAIGQALSVANQSCRLLRSR